MRHDGTVNGRDRNSLARDLSGNESDMNDLTDSVLAKDDGTCIGIIVQVECPLRTYNAGNAITRGIKPGINGKDGDPNDSVYIDQQNNLAFRDMIYQADHWDTIRQYDLLGKWDVSTPSNAFEGSK